MFFETIIGVNLVNLLKMFNIISIYFMEYQLIN